MTKITLEFKDAILSSDQPVYLLAASSGLHPSRLSRVLKGKTLGDSAKFDIRFRLLARSIGFSGAVFEGQWNNNRFSSNSS